MGMLQGGLLGQAAGSSDTVDLQAADCFDDATGGASATISCYWSGHGTRAGEVWNEQDQTDVYSHDPVDPKSNIGDYQMKWDALAGDAPNTGDAENTWIDLSSSSFDIGWSVGASDERAGTVTVSIRKGTGSVLDTAIWEGDVIASGKGK